MSILKQEKKDYKKHICDKFLNFEISIDLNLLLMEKSKL